MVQTFESTKYKKHKHTETQTLRFVLRRIPEQGLEGLDEPGDDQRKLLKGTTGDADYFPQSKRLHARQCLRLGGATGAPFVCLDVAQGSRQLTSSPFH